MSSPMPRPVGPLHLQITPPSFELVFTKQPYTKIHKSALKFLKRLCKSDLEKRIEENEDDDTYYRPSANEDDPRQQILHLCDWLNQEIKVAAKVS